MKSMVPINIGTGQWSDTGKRTRRGTMQDEVKWVKVAQSCLTLCDPMECSPPGSSVHGILQAPFPSSGDLPNPGIKPSSPALQADSLPAEPQGNPPRRLWSRTLQGLPDSSIYKLLYDAAQPSVRVPHSPITSLLSQRNRRSFYSHLHFRFQALSSSYKRAESIWKPQSKVETTTRHKSVHARWLHFFFFLSCQTRISRYGNEQAWRFEIARIGRKLRLGSGTSKRTPPHPPFF